MRTGVRIVVGLGLAGAGILLVSQLQSRRVSHVSGDGPGADVASVQALREEVSRLQGKVTALQVEAAEARTAAISAAPAPTEPGPSKAAPMALPPRPTQAEQIGRFERYFATLDSQRGASVDEQATGRFRDALTGPMPGLEAIKKEDVSLVTCGNGLCKIELTFSNEQAARAARSELPIRIGPMGSSASMYMDPDKHRVVAYFATPGTQMPQFPAPER